MRKAITPLLFLIPIYFLVTSITYGQDQSYEILTPANISEMSILHVMGENALNDLMPPEDKMSFSADSSLLYTAWCPYYMDEEYGEFISLDTVTFEEISLRQIECQPSSITDFYPEQNLMRYRNNLVDIESGNLIQEDIGYISAGSTDLIIAFEQIRQENKDYNEYIVTVSWRTQADNTTFTIGHTPNVFRMSPNNRYLAIGTNRDVIYIYDFEAAILKTIRAGQTYSLGVTGMAFHPTNDHLLVSIFSGGFVHLWDVETLAFVHELMGESAHKSVVRYNPQGTIIITGDDFGYLYAWDAETYEQILYINADDNDDGTDDQLQAVISNIEFSQDGKLLAVHRGWKISIWGVVE